MPEADCPDCGKHNCTGQYTDLNYCMWCGHPFNDVIHIFDKKPEPQAKIKTDLKGQCLLFGTQFITSK